MKWTAEFFVFAVAMVGIGGGFWECGHEYALHKQVDANFREQVQHHNCKIRSYYQDGKTVVGDLCVLPDGTIFTTTFPSERVVGK